MDANGTVHYLGGYERNVGTNQNQIDVTTKYYTATLGKVSRLIAFRKGSTLYYVGTDHLGGTVRVADANFVPVDQMRYAAYGASRDAGTNLNSDRVKFLFDNRRLFAYTSHDCPESSLPGCRTWLKA